MVKKASGETLTARLSAVARLAGDAAHYIVEPCTAADIGCDHGYVSIQLIRSGSVSKVIASDVRPGPLERARQNILAEGLSDRIDLRLCSGLSGLAAGEAQIAVMAGMGGRLIRTLLTDNDPFSLGIRALILQPQTEVMQLRRFLREKGWITADELMLTDSGKTYVAVRFFHGDAEPVDTACDEDMLRLYDRFGKILVTRRDPVLISWASRRRDSLISILEGIPAESGTDRREDLLAELSDTEMLLDICSRP